MKNFKEMSDFISKPSYTAVVLRDAERAKLLSAYPAPEGFEPIAHHMTINMGPASNGPAANMLGQEAVLKIISVASDDKVMAVEVETNVPSINKRKHITIGVNRAAGGKPVQSNNLANWRSVPPLQIHGIVAEVAVGGKIITPT